MNRWLDCIQIWQGCLLCISDDRINFWDESIKNKIAAAQLFKKKLTWWGHFFLIFYIFIYFYIGVVSPSLKKNWEGVTLFRGGGGGGRDVDCLGDKISQLCCILYLGLL